MNYRTLILALAAAVFMAAIPVAAQKTVRSFPERLVKAGQPKRQTALRAPLNQEAKLGTKVFGYTSIDYNRARSFVNYYENSYELEKLNPIYDGNDNTSVPDLYMVNAGAYNPSDGYYYAYKVEYYTIGITYAYQWLKVDPKDGSWEVIAELENDCHDHTFLYDMAYSPYDDEMFGLVQNDDGQVKSRIGIVDLSNSAVNDLVQLDEYYFAIAFNYDGDLYGIRWDYDKEGSVTGTKLDIFDKNFKVTKSMPILVDGTAYKSYYQHGLDVDNTTGELVWAATDSQGYQKMVRINPETGQTTNYGSVGWNEIMLGLHVPYTTAAHREAPAKAENLGFTIDANGENSVTVSWTNPTTTWNRKELTNLSSVNIYRDKHEGAPIATIDATGKEGSNMSYTDNGATQGIHKYYIIAVNEKGEGVERYVEAFVGHDVPGKVNDLRVAAKDNGKSVEITWTAPSAGANEGWFDKTITYDIERLPDHKTMATGISATAYTDANIPESQFYSYTITPSTSDGRGEPCTSEGILAGGSLKVPFSTEFATTAEAERFLSFDKYGGRNMFHYSHNNCKPGTMAMEYMYETTNDAILSSPPMNLEKGKTYRVDWAFTLDRYGYSYEDTYNTFKILGGTAPNAQAMTEVLAEHKRFLSVKKPESFVLTTYFVSPVDGDYCVGFNVATKDSNRKDDWIYVTAFAISESPADDLAANSIDCPLKVSANNDNYFDVEVYNNGANKQDTYKVEVGIYRLDGVFEPFASTDDVPAIESHASATVRVKGKTDKYGIQDIAARVVLEGDGNSNNDLSPYHTAKVEAGVAYNYHAKDANSTHMDSGIPMSVYFSNSASQTIYTAEMLGLEEELTPIGGLAWEYISQKNIDDAHIKVYLGTTDRKSYSDGKGTSFIATGNTLVYEGNVKFTKDEGDGIYKWMDVSFTENVFNMPKDKNLVVTVLAEETACNGDFPLLFKVFNSPNAGPNVSDELYHTIAAHDGKEIDIANPGKSYTYKEMPTLHVGLHGSLSGIDAVSGDNAGLNAYITAEGVRFSGNVVYAAVYDAAGRLVATANTRNAEPLRLNPGRGVHILKMQDAAGHTRTLRFVR